jgi:antitoxin (DNA-binding transcriptional repressor) of toxin-antitoxin stability system
LKLVDRTVANGESFIIAKAGKPMVKVDPLDQPERPKPRIVFMKGRIKAPDNFDELARDEIAALFEGQE